MISYITRINYGAVIAEMESATGISRSLLSMALTGSFITYGVGQIISGILGDKISPKKLLSLGFALTVCMNLLIPICQDPYQMLAVWCVNGFAQSFMWPPLVKIMTTVFTEDEYKKATVKVSWGSSIGTIVVYLVSPIIISLFNWQSMFYVCAACGLITLILWSFCTDFSVSDSLTSEKSVDTSKMSMGATLKMLFTPLIICIMIAIISQGMIRDGVTTWMHTYIKDTFDLGSAVSILTGVVLPIFSILTFQVALTLHRKKLTNPISCAAFFFIVGVVAALVLAIFSDANAVISVALSAILTGSMHGVNLILICMLPGYFKKHGNVSTVSGILNACTYIGSAISSFGMAVVSERFGWDRTLLVWLGVAVLGTIMCLVTIKPWAKVHPECKK
jgi:OPA family glycerol-3-phosphate transporter-like MFS transporter